MFRFKKLLVRFSEYYNLDSRSLALMRVSLALIVLLDLFIRGSDLLCFYGNKGIWPSQFVDSFSGKPGMWSLCTLFQNNWWILFLFALNVIFAITFLIGYKTKLSNFLLWLLALSFHNRNLYILQGGDDLLRILLFWGLFLPWHLHWSFDQRTKTNVLNDGIAKVAYLILIASVYFFSAALKSSIEWHSEASALYYVLSLDVFKTTLGQWLYQFPTMMKGFTIITLLLEYALPILILIPSKNGKLRAYAFLIICLMHLAFGLFLHVGLFFIISIVAGIGLIPSKWMDLVFEKKPMIKINQKSNLINSWYIVRNVFVISCMVLCLGINLSGVTWFKYQLKKELIMAVNFLRLDQYWGMFSPSIPKQNSWLVYQAYNAKGQQFDIQNHVEFVDFAKPQNFSLVFKSDRWRKLTENIQNDYYSFLRPHYCKYILKNWNKEHPENKMVILNLYNMTELILPNYKRKEARKQLLCVCDEY